jgi:hypothetical protein
MFHGQFAMNGLLEATDARLKEELSLVIPLTFGRKESQLLVPTLKRRWKSLQSLRLWFVFDQVILMIL